MDTRLVLLSFTRFPKEFRDALLASPLAVRHVNQGVKLEPSWASGGLVLAPDVTEDNVSESQELWHVAVRSGFEAEWS